MKQQHPFIGYLLVGYGIYFLINQLEFAFFANFNLWYSLLFITGIALLLYSTQLKSDTLFFYSVLIIGFSIHLHSQDNYEFWPKSWGMYVLIIGIALLIRYIKEKQYLILSLIFISISFIIIFLEKLPDSFTYVFIMIDVVHTFWPVLLIAFGAYILWGKK